MAPLSILRKAAPLGLTVVSAVAALLLGELVLRIVLNPGDFLQVTIVDHPYLGFRVAPGSPGHDVLGFRNRELPDHADVVAIGDSMTYGFGVPSAASWPHRLGMRLQAPVYNMALGGYGPLEYLYLAEHEATKLRPRLLLVGFCFGNDLTDAYDSVHRDTASTNAEGPRGWLARNSVLYSVSRVTLLQPLVSWEKKRLAMKAGPDRQMIWMDPSKPSIRTIFTPEQSLRDLDRSLPRVQEGLRLTTRAFASLKRAADAQGAQLLVVLIPTKERVYCRYLEGSGSTMPATLVTLCITEQQVKEDLVTSLAAENIAYVDVTGALEEQVEKHVQIYATEVDTHPNAAGHDVIARAVRDAVRRGRHDR